MEAEKLGIGTHIVTRAGPVLTVTGVEWNNSPNQAIFVYNFEVQEDHTYFVGRCDKGIWVHNVCAGYHHLIPRALGSLVPYRGTRSVGGRNVSSTILTYLSEQDHTDLHVAMKAYLQNVTKTLPNGTEVNMQPQNGNPGADVRTNFTTSERYAALEQFYRLYNGGRYYRGFRQEFRRTVNKGLWQ